MNFSYANMFLGGGLP